MTPTELTTALRIKACPVGAGCNDQRHAAADMIDRLLAELTEILNDYQDCTAYKDPFLVEKHGDLENIAACRERCGIELPQTELQAAEERRAGP